MAKHKQTLLTLIEKNFGSFILGIITVLVLLFAAFAYLSGNKIQISKKMSPPDSTKTVVTVPTEEPVHDNTQTYTVKEGDSLWDISAGVYGTGDNYLEVAKTNGISDPDIIYPGQTLHLPVITAQKRPMGETSSIQTSKVMRNDTTYVTQKGDYLWKIAIEEYGDGYMWPQIAKINNLIDPNFLSVGSKLQIPR